MSASSERTMSRAIVLCGVVLALCSCGSGAEEPAASSAPSSPRIATVTSTVGAFDTQVTRERRAMGRWRTRPGVLAGSRDQWLVVDVSGSLSVTVEIRSQGVRYQAVAASARGKAVMDDVGLSVTMKDAAGSLSEFSTFRAVFPTTATMLLTSSQGRTFDLQFDGV